MLLAVLALLASAACEHHDGPPMVQVCTADCSAHQRAEVNKLNREYRHEYRHGYWTIKDMGSEIWFRDSKSCEGYASHPSPLYGL